MAILKIVNVPGLTGEYTVDLSYFTNRELHKIKTDTGLRAGEFTEAFEALDNDLIVAMAIVFLERLAMPGARELLWDAAAGSIILEDTAGEAEENDDALPPVQ